MVTSQALGYPEKTDAIADFDAVIIGAGHVRPVSALRLRELGLTVRVFEAGTNVGGTWVLEPLSGRALRFRKLVLRLLVFQGIAGGMGLVRAFRRGARNRALS